VNYRDAEGAWKPIEDQLVSSGGGWAPKATGVPVRLPKSLAAGAVTVGSGGQEVSLRLEGAAGSEGSVSGTQDSYESCLAAALYAFCTNNGDEKFKAWPTRNQEQIEQVERENPDIFSDSEEDDSSLSLRDYLDTLRDDADGDE
jgi:hypothetical protein